MTTVLKTQALTAVPLYAQVNKTFYVQVLVLDFGNNLYRNSHFTHTALQFRLTCFFVKPK